MSQLYIKNALPKVQAHLQSMASSHTHVIGDVINPFLQAQGKLIRPALCLMSYAHSNLDDTILNIATSLECLHMASLVHDDIIDDSPLRRGQITIQSKYGKDVAVYTGDYLFTIAFECIQQVEPKLLLPTIRVMKMMLRGELLQKTLRFQTPDISAYLRVIYRKTASLFALACFEGATLNKEQYSKRFHLAKIGTHLGVLFQLRDDILDYKSTIDQLHKPVLEDISQGIYTLPFILAYHAEPSAFQPYLHHAQHHSQDDITLMIQLVHRYNGIEKAKQYANQFYHRINEELALLSTHPFYTSFKELADFLYQSISQ